MSLIGKVTNYIINIIMDVVLIIKDLQEKLYLKIKKGFRMVNKKTTDRKAIASQTLIDINELA